MSKKKTAKKYGDVNIPSEDFKDENTRVQISIKIPMTLLKDYRKEAARHGKGYQTLMLEALLGALPVVQKIEPIARAVSKGLGLQLMNAGGPELEGARTTKVKRA